MLILCVAHVRLLLRTLPQRPQGPILPWKLTQHSIELDVVVLASVFWILRTVPAIFKKLQRNAGPVAALRGLTLSSVGCVLRETAARDPRVRFGGSSLRKKPRCYQLTQPAGLRAST